jgi:hypothetical protein
MPCGSQPTGEARPGTEVQLTDLGCGDERPRIRRGRCRWQSWRFGGGADASELEALVLEGETELRGECGVSDRQLAPGRLLGKLTQPD